MYFLYSFVLIASTLAFASAGASEKFKKEFLDAHNDFRAKHGAPPLKLNDQISAHAQEWADHLAKTGQFEHNPKGGYGENLWAVWAPGSGPFDDGAAAVKSWYDEIEKYTYFGKEPNMRGFMDFGHFTQLVWKGTTEVGVGVATSSGSTTTVVANYGPPGNRPGSFSSNVLAKL